VSLGILGIPVVAVAPVSGQFGKKLSSRNALLKKSFNLDKKFSPNSGHMPSRRYNDFGNCKLLNHAMMEVQ